MSRREFVADNRISRYSPLNERMLKARRLLTVPKKTPTYHRLFVLNRYKAHKAAIRGLGAVKLGDSIGVETFVARAIIRLVFLVKTTGYRQPILADARKVSVSWIFSERRCILGATKARFC